MSNSGVIKHYQLSAKERKLKNRFLNKGKSKRQTPSLQPSTQNNENRQPSFQMGTLLGDTPVTRSGMKRAGQTLAQNQFDPSYDKFFQEMQSEF